MYGSAWCSQQCCPHYYRTSLSLWTRKPKPKAKDLYPGHIANPSLRSAITIQAEISCKVFLTQVRLDRFGKAADDCCRLCLAEWEDVEHLVATCPALSSVHQGLIKRIKDNLNTKQFRTTLRVCPCTVLGVGALSSPGPTSNSAKTQLHTLILYFIRNLHTTVKIYLTTFKDPQRPMESHLWNFGRLAVQTISDRSRGRIQDR